MGPCLIGRVHPSGATSPLVATGFTRIAHPGRVVYEVMMFAASVQAATVAVPGSVVLPGVPKRWDNQA